MLKSWNIIVVFLAITGFIAILGFGFTTNPKIVPSPFIGKPAPDFEVIHLNGEERLKLSHWQGKPVVLNFWASWCFACRQEAPVLKSSYERYEVQRNQIRFVGIAIQDTQEKAREFARQYKKKYFLAIDGENGRIAMEYGIYGVPETFFIDAEGIIRFKHVGAVTEKLMEKQIQNLRNFEKILDY